MLELCALDGTMSAEPKGLVCRNTLNVAVATPTESGVFACPKLKMGRQSMAVMSQGFGRGALVRKACGVATFTLRTPCPP